MSDLRPKLVEDLLRPDAYPEPPNSVDLVETHISWVFLAGERVYKVKKPVDLGFLDFTDRARRRHFCREEVRLNRRLAPEVYLGVVEIGREPDGRHRLGAPGEPCEPAVEMRRLPEAEMLPARLASGRFGPREEERLVELLVRFHAAARRGPEVEQHGTSSAVRANAEENFAQMGPWAVADATRAPVFDPQRFAELRRWTHAFLDEHEALFARRLREGRICEGHGDLHAGNLCFVAGRPLAFDCIEFSERFRCGDVASELAFLSMDLRRRGAAPLADQLAVGYARASGDAELFRLLPFYETYRSLVRAKIAAFRTGLPAAGDADVAEARAYFDLAWSRSSAAAPAPNGVPSVELPASETHPPEGPAMNVLFHTESFELSEDLRHQLEGELSVLSKVVATFPLRDLHVHIHRHPQKGDFHLKMDLHLPGATLMTGERGLQYHPLFTACAKQLLSKAKAFKEQLDHRSEWSEARPEKA